MRPLEQEWELTVDDNAVDANIDGKDATERGLLLDRVATFDHLALLALVRWWSWGRGRRDSDGHGGQGNKGNDGFELHFEVWGLLDLVGREDDGLEKCGIGFDWLVTVGLLRLLSTG